MADGVMFIDSFAPRAYDSLSDMEGLGGTESTIMHIALGLAPDLRVAIAQSQRETAETHDGVAFLPFPTDTTGFDTLIVINSWKLAVKLRKERPDARIAVWLHVFPGKHNRELGNALHQADVTVIPVSHSHGDWLRAFCPDQAPRIHPIYNPIPDDLAPDDTPRDPNLLLFASAPHKGLDQVIARFGKLLDRFPDLRLEIADPGYMEWPVPHEVEQGLVWLGTLRQDELFRHYRRALCLFMPQTTFAETFGLVIAEANAVGCPALLQTGLGANDEVACPGSALIDVTDIDAITAALAGWRDNAPECGANPAFRLSAVLDAWRDWLNQPDAAQG